MRKNCKIRIGTEIQCWKIGFDLMLAHGFFVTLAQIKYCLNCLDSYVGYEFREYIEKCLLELRMEIKGHVDHL
jgi:hypothetical protein